MKLEFIYILNLSLAIIFIILQIIFQIKFYQLVILFTTNKTGTLDNLEHDAGIVYLPNTDYIICVLTNNLKSNKDGKEITGLISKAVYDEFC